MGRINQQPIYISHLTRWPKAIIPFISKTYVEDKPIHLTKNEDLEVIRPSYYSALLSTNQKSQILHSLDIQSYLIKDNFLGGSTLQCESTINSNVIQVNKRFGVIREKDVVGNIWKKMVEIRAKGSEEDRVNGKSVREMENNDQEGGRLRVKIQEGIVNIMSYDIRMSGNPIKRKFLQ